MAAAYGSTTVWTTLLWELWNLCLIYTTTSGHDIHETSDSVTFYFLKSLLTDIRRKCILSNMIRINCSSTLSGCWESHPNASGVHGVAIQPGQEDRPRLFYFGTTTDQAYCKNQCAMEPLCYAYALIGPSFTSWVNHCYGRGFGAPEIMFPRVGMDSGLKICWLNIRFRILLYDLYIWNLSTCKQR